MRLIVPLLFSVINVCEAKEVPVSDIWHREMLKMKSTLTEILPYATTNDLFNAPQNAMPIDNAIRSLLSSSEILVHNKKNITEIRDPTMDFVAQYFENNLRAVLESNRLGRRDYSRLMVLNTTHYCIECHTRTKSEPPFFEVKLAGPLLQLNPVKKVEYLISIRQFQDALKLLIRSLEKNRELPIFGGETLLRYGLILTVKCFNDPHAALKMLKAIQKSTALPLAIKNNIENWKTELHIWKNTKNSQAEISEDQILKLALELLEKAQILNVQKQSIHAGDVEVLRASAMVQNLFKNRLNETQSARALFLLGQAYQMFPEHLFWVLHEHYYEACIRVLPHSTQAEECFKFLEESINFGYTGTLGTFIPETIVRRMSELRRLSEQKTKKGRVNKSEFK